MSLRKSPIRTAAMLAANRANARKSTGPCTAAGKRTSAMNALRSGFYSRAPWAGEPCGVIEEQAFEAFCQTLRVAVVAADTETGKSAVRACALKIWKARRALNHWIEWESQARRKARQMASGSPQGNDGVQTAAPARMPYRMPAPQTVVFERPGIATCRGWKLKVSIRVRWGRSPACLRLGDMSLESAMAAWRAWRARRREHTVVVVTCTGHPWTCRHRQRLRTEPESHRKGAAWKDVITAFEKGATEVGLAPADFGIPSAAAVGCEGGIMDQAAGGWVSAPCAGTELGRNRAQSNSLMANEAGICQKTGDLQKCDDGTVGAPLAGVHLVPSQVRCDDGTVGANLVGAPSCRISPRGATMLNENYKIVTRAL
jgi:hypothetical protein